MSTWFAVNLGRVSPVLWCADVISLAAGAALRIIVVITGASVAATVCAAMGCRQEAARADSQRRWRERGGAVIRGEGTGDLAGRVAELEARQAAQDEVWEAWARSRGVAPPHGRLTVVPGLSRSS